MTKRLLLIILVGLAAFFYIRYGMQGGGKKVQAMPAQNRSVTRQMDALAYLNHIRQQSGLQPFARSELLERSASAHADYLIDFPEDGHDEKHSNSPLFTGRTPAIRMARAGYETEWIQENVSTHRAGSIPDLNVNEEHRQLDGLFTAIYHRFSLLTQTADEAGIGYAQGKDRIALVVNEGNGVLNRLCSAQISGQVRSSPHAWTGVCRRGVLYIDQLPENRYLPYVAYPQGSDARPDYHSEIPDPMPGHEVTGNPVSIEFKPRGKDEPLGIGMLSFDLYQGGRQIKDVKVLTSDNDPNRLFNDHQFALFPLQPLEYDTEYRAVFRYIEKGQEKEAAWTFRTKRPDFPWFDMKGKTRAAIKPDQVYFIRWDGKGCLKNCPALHYRQIDKAVLTIHQNLADGILVSVKGRGQIRLFREDRPKDVLTLEVD